MAMVSGEVTRELFGKTDAVAAGRRQGHQIDLDKSTYTPEKTTVNIKDPKEISKFATNTHLFQLLFLGKNGIYHL